MKKLKFPKGFFWGASTSAYQVEGGIKNDWSEWGSKFDAGIACDHYNKFEEDFDSAKAMNNNAHRFSIEWARIEPEEGKFDQAEIEHYRNVILTLKERNLEPFVTLFHFTLPAWFSKKGGWLNKDAPKYFERFVEKIVGEYKDLVKFWITLNEPNIYVFHSFLEGNWLPFKKNWFKSNKILKQLIKTHISSYQLIHKISPISKIGIAINNIYYKGVVKLLVNYYWNQNFLNKIRDSQDFIGLNYYFGYSLRGFLKSDGETDLGWGIYPRGIYYVLQELRKYNRPIYITENGLADKNDEKRTKFIIDHLKWVHKAIKEGIDVRGYFHWSLMDNFEWDKGFEPRFGLIEIDYKTLKRIPRPSSKIYAKICKANAINI